MWSHIQHFLKRGNLPPNNFEGTQRNGDTGIEEIPMVEEIAGEINREISTISKEDGDINGVEAAMKEDSINND